MPKFPQFKGMKPEIREAWFWSRLEKAEDCLIWTGGVNKITGYGHTWYLNKPALAHRLAYIYTVGEIPEGLMLDHLCRNKICVNPEHLEVVTNAENQRRGNASKLSLENVEAIKMKSKQGESQYSIANTFKINQSTVNRIVNGKRWRIA